MLEHVVKTRSPREKHVTGYC